MTLSAFVDKKHYEIGAQWIHGEEGNDAYEIAESIDLVHDDNYPANVSTSSGDSFCDDDIPNCPLLGDLKLKRSISGLAEDWRDVGFVTNDGRLVPASTAKKMGILAATLEAEEFGKITRVDDRVIRTAGNSISYYIYDHLLSRMFYCKSKF